MGGDAEHTRSCHEVMCHSPVGGRPYSRAGRPWTTLAQPPMTNLLDPGSLSPLGVTVLSLPNDFGRSQSPLGSRELSHTVPHYTLCNVIAPPSSSQRGTVPAARAPLTPARIVPTRHEHLTAASQRPVPSATDVKDGQKDDLHKCDAIAFQCHKRSCHRNVAQP